MTDTNIAPAWKQRTQQHPRITNWQREIQEGRTERLKAFSRKQPWEDDAEP